MEAVRVHFPEDLRMNDDEFFRFCQDNPILRFERCKNGDIAILSLSDGITGNLNIELGADLGLWNRQSKWGYFFDSSTAFRLSDTSVMAPDVAGVSKARWETLTASERRRFVPLCPDFILELLSPSDRLIDAQQKMDGWMANGCQLGWLLDLGNKTAYMYKPEHEVAVHQPVQVLTGDDTLPNFTLYLSQL